MYHTIAITKDLYFVGGSDRKISLFENVYPVSFGMSYNSYLLLDEKTVLFDTVDSSCSDLFFQNLDHVLNGRELDYIIVHHVEPDHSGAFLRLIARYPKVKLVTSSKAAEMLSNFFPFDPAGAMIVKEGDTLSTGRHELKFIAAPMVHWPEVMFSYDQQDKILFSADAFGKFGALEGSISIRKEEYDRDWLNEARRYYFNIVGKYGVQVQNVLKKAAALPIQMICPLHGPILKEDIKDIWKKYDLWSRYEPEEKGVVLFYGSIHGHTANACDILAEEIAKNGVQTKIYDVSKTELSFLLSEAFRYSHAVFLSATYNNGIFLPMEHLINDLSAHLYQNRRYSIVECGSWAPQAGDLMEKAILGMKNMTRIGEKVTILSSVKDPQANALRSLAKSISDSVSST